jgi:cell division protein FtsQ
MTNNNSKVSSIEDRIPRLKELRKRKANNRLIIYISLFFLLIAVIVYAQSPLSNLQHVEIIGNNYVSNETILLKSELNEGVNYWEIETDEIKRKLLQLQQVKDVQVEKVWFNSINLVIKEHPHIAYLQIDGDYYPIIETGEMLSPLTEEEWPVDAPILVNWEKGEELLELSDQLKKVEKQIISRISEIHHYPSDIDPWRMLIFMNDGYEVIATIGSLSDNISYYPTILEELAKEGYPEGIIHLEVGSYFEYTNKKAEDTE